MWLWITGRVLWLCVYTQDLPHWDVCNLYWHNEKHSWTQSYNYQVIHARGKKKRYTHVMWWCMMYMYAMFDVWYIWCAWYDDFNGVFEDVQYGIHSDCGHHWGDCHGLTTKPWTTAATVKNGKDGTVSHSVGHHTVCPPICGDVVSRGGCLPPEASALSCHRGLCPRPWRLLWQSEREC